MTDFEKKKWRAGNEDAEARANELKGRFSKVSKMSQPKWYRRRRRFKSAHAGDLLKRARLAEAIRQWLMIFGLLVLLAFAIHLGAIHKGWTFSETVRHLAAMPNCSAARIVGLAPAKLDQPGYYIRHDADQDGIACEPLPVWKR